MARASSGRFSAKPWSDLSPKTRAEKLRHGIGPKEHAAGVSVKKVQAFERELVRLYDRDREEVRQELKSYDMLKVSRAIDSQRRMAKLYDQGRSADARALWEKRDQSLPEWMFYYHGAFS